MSPVFSTDLLIGRPGESGESEDQPNTGVVTIVESGEVCIADRRGDHNECYRAPGRGLRVGDEVRFSTMDVPIDPADSSKGTQRVLVYATVAEDPQGAVSGP